MRHRIKISLKLPIILWMILLTGCQKNNELNLVIIADRDTISVNQFNILLDKKYGKKAADLTVNEKRQYLDLMVTNRLKMLYGVEKGFEKEIALDEEKAKQGIVLTKANEKYILGAFLAEPDVEEYRRHLGVTVISQNLVVRFKDRPMSPVALSKEDARKRADSIFAVISANNYNAIAERTSDFKNPSTQKGNTRTEKLTIGQLPYTYEKVVFKMKPNEISGPVEVPGAFVIIHLMSKDFSTHMMLDKDEVTDFMMSKLDDVDQFLIGPFQMNFSDSLYRSGDVRMDDQNILFLSDRLKDTVDVRASVNLFTAEEQNLVLARFNGGAVTLRSFLENYGPGIRVKFNAGLLSRAVETFCKALLMRKLIVDDGFLDTEEYRYLALSVNEALIVGRVDESIVSAYTGTSEEGLRKFYNDNRSRYRTDGSIVVSEISTPHRSEIQKIQQTLTSGVAFEQAAAKVKGDEGKLVAKFSPNVTFNFLAKNEIISRAMKMNKGDVSDIINRKDGSFSMIRLVSKLEPQLMDFASARKRVENDYKRFTLKNAEMELLMDLKKKWPVVVYENNLNGN